MLFIIVAIFTVASFIYKFLWKCLFCDSNKVDFSNKEEWYGEEDPNSENEDSSVRPFKIDVPDSVLEDLKLRLENPRFEEPVKDSKFHYGFNPRYLKEVAEYWKNKYNWRKEEAMLNKYPSFKTRIEGIDVHFLHAKPTLPEDSKLKVIPLMIIHGWPGSFAEFIKTIPYLIAPRQNCSYVFEVICPSIPGFGFSESPHRKGLHAAAAARIFLTVMERIGHQKFYVQGGDWGSFIASAMARLYPSRILGLHVNMYSFMPQGLAKLKLLLPIFFPFLLNKNEHQTVYPLKKWLPLTLQETGYFHMQCTKPDTLGCAMSDSPIGTAAYLLEKFSVATNVEYLKLPDGGLTKKFSLDELLTAVMIYWVNNNFTAAARFYKENIKEVLKQRIEKIPVIVPSGVAVFPNEVIMMPRMLMTDQMKNMVSFSLMPRGGHFAAFEEPQLFADDLWKFVSIVEKKNG